MMGKSVDIPKIIGTQGWEQFQNNKHEILYQFDLAKKYSQIHIVQVSHGNVAEALFRTWLESFLPDKYGITSGYIVSQSPKFIDSPLPHYDVIIYEKLNSPNLWLEKSPDLSVKGQARAIPAEYVRAVLEVKSNLTAKTAKDSLKKLSQLEALFGSRGNDEKYKGMLHPSFFAFSIFFEIEKANQYKASILDELNANIKFPYRSGLILRAEGRSINETGRFSWAYSKEEHKSTVGKNKSSLLHNFSKSASKPNEYSHSITILEWGQSDFAIFAFDLLSLLEGNYRPGHVSSFHSISWENTKFNDESKT